MMLKELLREHENVVTLNPEARISEAAELMRRENIGSIVIVDTEHVVGIITDRDIALSVSLGAATPDSFVEEVMSEEVETVSDSMTLEEVSRVFRTVRVKRLPVIDQNERLIGIVSADDVIMFLSRELFNTCSSLEPKLRHIVY